MANNENLIPANKRSLSEARENGKKGGIASGKARREKKTIKEGIITLMGESAPDAVRNAFSKSGYDVDTNLDAVIASIATGAMKGNPKAQEKVLEFLGEDVKTKIRQEELKMQKARLKLEKQKAELEIERAKIENERQRLWLEAVKAQQGESDEQPDDGFIEALKGSAAEDWDEENI